MEFFLVFLLGMALVVVILFIARPSLFTRNNPEFSLFEVMVEESISELEERQKEFLQEIEKRHASLLELHNQMIRVFLPEKTQSPKVLAVLELADEGHDEQTIAKRLGLGTGEVQLILELNKESKSLEETG